MFNYVYSRRKGSGSFLGESTPPGCLSCSFPPPAQRSLVLPLSLRSLYHSRNFPFLGYEKEMVQWLHRSTRANKMILYVSYIVLYVNINYILIWSLFYHIANKTDRIFQAWPSTQSLCQCSCSPVRSWWQPKAVCTQIMRSLCPEHFIYKNRPWARPGPWARTEAKAVVCRHLL